MPRVETALISAVNGSASGGEEIRRSGDEHAGVQGAMDVRSASQRLTAPQVVNH